MFTDTSKSGSGLWGTSGLAHSHAHGRHLHTRHCTLWHPPGGWDHRPGSCVSSGIASVSESQERGLTALASVTSHLGP